MKFRAEIRILLKEGVLDTQGKAVMQSLESMGYTGLCQVNVGKLLHVFLEAASPDEATKQVDRMCDDLLVNTLIERYDIHVEACA